MKQYWTKLSLAIVVLNKFVASLLSLQIGLFGVYLPFLI